MTCEHPDCRKEAAQHLEWCPGESSGVECVVVCEIHAAWVVLKYSPLKKDYVSNTTAISLHQLNSATGVAEIFHDL